MTDTDTSVDRELERLIRSALQAGAATSDVEAAVTRRPPRRVALVLAGFVVFVGLAGIAFVLVTHEPDMLRPHRRQRGSTRWRRRFHRASSTSPSRNPITPR